MPQPQVQSRRPIALAPALEILDGAATWDQAVDEFLRDCRRRNLSRNTVEGVYSWVLRGPRVQAFCLDHDVREAGQFDAARLRRFEEELTAAGLSPRSVSIFHRTLKTFARFCIDRGWATEEDILRVRGPRLPSEHPVGFTPAEEQKLLVWAGRSGARDAMLLEFMLRTGLRLSEVCGVTLDDIVAAPEGAFLRVRQGKGRKDRIVPLDSPGCELSRKLDHYVRRVRPRTTRQSALFLSLKRTGPGGDYSPLTPNGITQMFKRLSAATGIAAHPHRCRHHFATRSLAAGLNPLALQRALGHTTMTMTSRYVSASAQDLLDAWKLRRD